MAIGFLSLVIAAAFGYWMYSWFIYLTYETPEYGGSYTEGIIGQPMHINPVLATANEVDSDIAALIYDGLFRYDEFGAIEPSMAESWTLSEDKKVYTVKLRGDLKWHDGSPVRASDALFTYQIILDPAFRSPLRQNWQGVEFEQTDDLTIVFKLSAPYFGFLDNLTVGILPKHLWENVNAEQFGLVSGNLEPIGSGPYRFVKMQKDSGGDILGYDLESYAGFHDGTPYITKFSFQFYPDRESLLEAYRNKEVRAMGSIDPNNVGSLQGRADETSVHSSRVPHYFLVFFNQSKSVPLSYDEVREALTLAVNRDEIIGRVLAGRGVPVQMSFLPGMPGYDGTALAAGSRIEDAKKILEEKGWKTDESGIRSKDGTRLEFDLLTADWPEFAKTADELSRQWKEIGAQVNVKVLGVYDLTQNYIRPREYGALLFAQATNFNPDIYAYWHSSQKRDPGFNLSLLNDKDADKLLEESRTQMDTGARAELFRKVQEIINKRNPAIYLFSPLYLYPVETRVRGMIVENMATPSGRFTHVRDWYIKTKRVFK